ncbi:MAG: hypothetical protein A3F14_03240 [Gammaproteobacteria bacterium RIFCSPHIGHO2_12_FULL_43_28]|nr:MAG: hypothetical protein A3F14_03240 [Gammaproteobacteria bacterium RIFCSPHIGHO2_12_FULL_43_28]
MSFKTNANMVVLISLLLSSNIFAGGRMMQESSTETWLKQSAAFDIQKIIENISPLDADKGAIIAARTRVNPNYYYHWVRDAGITMDALSAVYPERSAEEKLALRKLFFDYVSFCKKIQKTKTLTGLGEPKFKVDGSAFNDPWARPQNDSPAMRAISLIEWANQLIADGHAKEVSAILYPLDASSEKPIKLDLDYIVAHWRDASYDLWEEVKGKHFYALMVERRALLLGARLAHYFRDDASAEIYQREAKAIEPLLLSFWDEKRGFIVETLDREGGVNYKHSNIDAGVVLGLLHGDMQDGFLSWDDPRVVATIETVIHAFQQLYTINQRNTIPGFAIGRYPEDKYAGSNFDGGNPWTLCTLAIAEAYYRYANALNAKGQTDAAVIIQKRADQFVERVRYHAHVNGSLNEQIDRNTGYMTSVEDLTWNYAALLQARQSMLGLLLSGKTTDKGHYFTTNNEQGV